MRREEEAEFQQTIAKMKKRKADPMLHCEGETDVEDIYDTPSQATEVPPVVPPVKPVGKKVKKPGPTLRSHSQVEEKIIPQWAPSDEEDDPTFLKEEDDDGFEPVPFVLPSGRKSRAKKAKQKTWYDETRDNPEQQFKVSLCFKDVYQFRQALSRLHIVQVRNYHFHRNTPDRVIVWCKQKDSNKWDCPFYMTASKIKNKPTFYTKKMHLKHSYPIELASTRVNAKWLSSA
jgi:hypothetical protein